MAGNNAAKVARNLLLSQRRDIAGYASPQNSDDEYYRNLTTGEEMADVSGNIARLSDPDQTTFGDYAKQRAQAFKQYANADGLIRRSDYDRIVGQIVPPEKSDLFEKYGVPLLAAGFGGLVAGAGGFAGADSFGFGGDALSGYAGGAVDYPAFAGADYLGAGGGGGGGVFDAWGVGPRGTDMTGFMNNYADPFAVPDTGLMDFNIPGAGTDFAGTYPGLSTNAMSTAGGLSLAPGAGLTFGGSGGLAELSTKLTTKIGETAAKSTISKLLNGTAGADDYARIFGALGAAGLGALGANAQQNSLSGIADKYLGLGAAHRARLEQSYQPGFDLSKQDPAYQGALDQASKSVLGRLSATSGNPFDNPGALMEANKYVTQSTALPALQTYRSQLGTFGQLGTNTAGGADVGAAQAGSGIYDALGYGLSSLTNPQPDLASLLRQFTLNNGSTF